MSGRPYKKEKYYRNIKRFGVVCAIWNFGFIIKFLTALGGQAIYDLDDNTTTDLFTACCYAISDFLTMVIPFYVVIDAKFVKIFSFKALENAQTEINLAHSTANLEQLDHDTSDQGLQLLLDNE